MTATVHHFDPLLTPRLTREERRANNNRILAKHNGDNTRLEQLMRSRPGPTARRFLDDLAKVNIGRGLVTGEQRTVIVHPSASRPVQRSLPLYDQAADRASRIPEALQWPLTLLVQNVEEPGSVGADALLAAAAAVREYNTPIVVPPVVGEGNELGMPRP